MEMQLMMNIEMHVFVDFYKSNRQANMKHSLWKVFFGSISSSVFKT